MNKKMFIIGFVSVVIFINICFFCSDPVKPDFGQAPVIGNDKKITMSGIPEKDSILYLILTAEGTEPLNFQWYKNDTIISRSSLDSLKFEPLKLSDTGSYYCIVSNKYGRDTSKSADISLTPKFKVMYDGNTATSGAVPTDDNSYAAGATVTVLGNNGNLAKTGHTFAGWNTKADGSGTSYSGGDIFTISSADVILYARWTTNPTYTVTYNGNGNTGGAVPIDGNNYETDATVTVRGNTGNLIKTGHTFAGWNTLANGSGTSYMPGDTFIIGSANVILYARWNINIYVVRFNSNGGSQVDSQSVAHNNTATEPTPPTRNGYIFAGWYSDQALTTAFIFTTPITATITLYAKWTAVYTVTYNENNNTGGSVPVDTNKYISGAIVTVLDNTGSLVKTGYTFSKWNTNAAGTGTDRTPGETFAIGSQNVTLYAKWNGNPYTVTFNSNGGTLPNPSSITVIFGSTYGTLATTSRTGYTFNGWWSDTGGSGVEIKSSNTVNVPNNHTLYAQWVIKDADGNIYTEITIGTQGWMVENLKTTRYNDGTEILFVTDSTTWANFSAPAYCWYNNDISYKDTFGALYNWHAVSANNPKKIAPPGWHVPTDDDWYTLENYLIANGYNWDGTTTGNKIAKSLAVKTGWNVSTIPGAIGNDLTMNNKSGFSAFPGGYRNSGDGYFYYMGGSGYWWSATDVDSTCAYNRYLHHGYGMLYRASDMYKKNGFSVRLLRN